MGYTLGKIPSIIWNVNDMLHVVHFTVPVSCTCRAYTIAVFSLYGECVARSLLTDGVFLPCDHRLDFLVQSINQSWFARVFRDDI